MVKALPVLAIDTVENFMYLCGGLNVTGLPHFIENGIFRRCGFVGVCMTLLEEVCHGERGL